MDNWKVPAIVAGGAFVLSFLIGLFSGALFGIVFLRAFMFAVVGGGLALAVPFVADRYLPPVDETDEPAPGASVDIVLDQENPHMAPSGDFIEEVEEGPSFGKESGDVVDTLPDDDTVADLEAVDDAEEVSEVSEPSAASADVADAAPVAAAPRPMRGLPSMEGFEDSFSPSLPMESGGDSGGSPGGGLGGGFADTVSVDGSEHDPREIAKAVQTILKKDQEG